MASRRPGYRGFGLALAFSSVLGSGCSSEVKYIERPSQTVYVDRPVERVVYIERHLLI